MMPSLAWHAEEMTIIEFHKLLRIDPSIGPELVKRYLEAIAQHDGTLKALITINSDAIKIARDKAIETSAFNKRDKPFPLLHSVPIILKDNLSTSDLPTSAGVKALQNLYTKDDSEVVSRLRAAGAIILAKSNLHEFALQGISLSSLGGQTLNPYDLTRTPGDPQAGQAQRWPRTSALPDDTAGPMGRSVGDVRALYRVMKEPVGASEGLVEDVSATKRQPGRQIRIGVLEAYFQPEIHGDIGANTETEYLTENQTVQDIVRTSLSLIQQREEDIVLVSIPPSSHPDWSSETLLIKADTQAFEFKDCLNEFLQLPLISSTPHRTLGSIAQSGEFDPTAMTDVFFASLRDPETFSTTSEAYRSRLEHITILKESVRQCFDDFDIDALVYPHQRQLPVKIGAKKQSGRNGILAALTGRPAICIPAGWSPRTESAVLGLPVGMELMGRRWKDDELLDLAERIESVLKGRREPALIWGSR
ncbi:Amidase [Penicillium paradoxum]|uniref:Amidase n=1 Tax=Penicillium paradoxum TaxID=176176 RepID=UPI00254872B0|nr:Amidase [Penicillium paradoxum]KAJ5779946.1 Amidase [Penicillium paradoxum]